MELLPGKEIDGVQYKIGAHGRVYRLSNSGDWKLSMMTVPEYERNAWRKAKTTEDHTRTHGEAYRAKKRFRKRSG